MERTVESLTRMAQVAILILALPELSAALAILLALALALFSDTSRLNASHDAIVYILYNARSIGFIILIEIIYRIWLSRRRALNGVVRSSTLQESRVEKCGMQKVLTLLSIFLTMQGVTFADQDAARYRKS